MVSDDRGSTAVEFAIISVAVILLLLVTIETGRALLTHNTLESVAEEAARCAAIEWNATETDPPSRSCTDAATTQAFVVLKAGQRGVTVTSDAVAVTKPAASTDCGAVGTFVAVQITHSFTPVIGFAGYEAIPIKGKACYPG